MKKALLISTLISLLVIAILLASAAQTSIDYSSFESGSQGWTDGGSDSQRSSTRSNTTDSGTPGGSWSWKLQDGSSTSYFEQAFDFTGFDEVNLTWAAYYLSIENTEALEMRCDGTVLWQYEANTEGTEDRWIGHQENQQIPIYPTNCTFDSSVTIRFEAEFSGNGDDVWIDAINITGITAEVADSEFPIFSNFQETPANSSIFTQNQIYEFNSTIFSTNGTAGIEFNGINYTASNLSNIFNLSFQNLAAGTYNYYWYSFGNGTSNNYNTSQIKSYTISKAQSNISLFLNHSISNITIYQYQEIYLNGTLISGDLQATLQLLNNGSLINSGVSPISNLTNFTSLGLHNISLYYIESQNYTQSSQTFYINVIENPDIISPDISIQSPIETNYSTLTIDLNTSSTATDINTWWYSLNSGETNTTFTPNTTITASEGFNSLTVYLNDTSNNQNSTQINFTVDSIPPSFDHPLQNSELSENQSFSYQINASDSGLGLQTYSVNDSNFQINSSGFLTNSTVLAISLYYLNITINDSLNNQNSSVFYVNVTALPDTTQPYFTSIPTSINISYPNDITAQFNAEDETQLDSYTSNSTLFTINSSGFLNNSQSLAAGTYNINITINDTSNNLNSTIFQIHIRQNNTYEISIDLSPSSTETYPTETTSTGLNCPTEISCTLHLDNSPVSNPHAITLAAGTYNYTFNSTGNTNYSSKSISSISTINNATGNITLLINSQSANQTSPYQIQTNASAATLYGSITLLRNGVDITSENHENTTLAAGTYNYTAISPGDQNHSSATITRFIHITKAQSNISLFLNHSQNNITIPQGISIQLNSSLITGDPQATLQLYNNNSLINSGVSPLSNLSNFTSSGLQNITAIYIESQNYTQSSQILYINVTPPDITPPHFTLIPANAEINYTQPIQINFEATDNSALDSFTQNSSLFEINQSGTLTNSTVLAAGTYNINITINDTSNNENSTIYQIQVNRAQSTCTISSNSPQEYPNPINVSAFCDNPESSLQLFRNNINVTPENHQLKVLGADTYTYMANTTQTQNYTNASTLTSVTVNQNSSLQLSISTTPSPSVTYPTETTITGLNCPVEITCTLNTNQSQNITNPHTTTFGVESSPVQYTYNTSGNTNYSATSTIQILTINQNTSSEIQLFLNHSQSNITIYNNTQIYLNASLQTGVGTIQLFNSGSLINSGTSPLSNLTTFTTLGLHNITTQYSGNANYSQTIKTFYVNVTQIPDTTPPTLEIISPQNTSYTNATILVNISASDTFLDTIWFFNSTENQTFTSPIYITFSQGSTTLIAYSNDTSNNLNSSQVTFSIDSLTPIISFTLPSETNSSNLNRNYILINSTSTDTNLANITIFLFNSTYNQINSSTSLTSPNFINFSSLQDGIYYFNSTATDTFNNQNSTETRTVTIDTVPPSLIITTPQNISYNQIQTEINYTISETNPQACWYSLDQGETNITITCGNNISSLTSNQGSNTWKVYSNDTSGNTNTSKITFLIDSLSPSISYISPTPSNFSTLAQNFIEINISASDTNLETITIYLSNTTSLIQTNTSSSSPLYLNISSLSDGIYYINASVSDSFDNQNSTETRTITLDNTLPGITIHSPQSQTYQNTSILINISTINSQSVWFYNGTGNETYSSEIYRSFPEGSNSLTAYANNSAGTINSQSVTFTINTLQLTCEAGGPYQSSALVLIQGTLTNETSQLNNKKINISIYKSSILNRSSTTQTTANGTYQTTISNLSDGNYTLNSSASHLGFNISCIDTFQIGTPAFLTLDKIATVYNISNTVINYNITLKLTNTGGSESQSTNITDSDSTSPPYFLGTLQPQTTTQVSYILNLTRQNTTSYHLSPQATAQALDSTSNSLIQTSSTAINLTIPPVSIGTQLVITKNIIFVSEASLNVTYNISATLFNSGDNDLEDINYIDTDLSPTALVLNLSKGTSQQFSNILTIAKAASNTEHEFALGTATISSETFYSNRPKINIPGYGGPADVIVHAPATVEISTSFDSVLQIKNANADIGQDFTLSYHITSNDESQNFTSGSQTIYVPANTTLNITATLTSPSTPNTYKLRASTSWPAGIATAFDTFYVTSATEPPTEAQSPSGNGGGGGGPTTQTSPTKQDKTPEPPNPPPTESEEPEEEIICTQPYIRHGEECCLDENSNSICDIDERDNPLTGFIVKNLPTQKTIINIITVVIILAILIFLLILISYLLKKRTKKHFNRLTKIKNIKVYTQRGVFLGTIKDIFLIANRIDSIQIKLLNKIKKALKIKKKIKGISINYKHVRNIKDIALVDSDVLDKLQDDHNT